MGEVDKGTSRRVNKLIATKDRVTRGRVDKGTSGRVNKLIAKKDRVTRGRVDEWTGKRVDCEGRQSNRGTEVGTYNIWGEKGLKKTRD